MSQTKTQLVDGFNINTSVPADSLVIDSSGNVGLGTSSPDANFHVSATDATTARIAFTGSCTTSFGQSSAGLELVGGAANTTAKYFPAIKFGSTDGQFTTKPKFVAAITAEAAELYGADTDGGASLAFWTTPDNPGTGGDLRQRLTILNSGNVGIGTTSPTTELEVQSASNTTIRIDNEDDSTAQLYFHNTGSTDMDISVSSANMTFNHGASERARIDSSGRLLVGTSSSPSADQGSVSRIIAQGYVGSDTNGGIISLQRGEAAASITSGELLGRISFNDSAGYSFAQINAYADGTAGASDYPGVLTFSTTADGASSPTEHVRINNEGSLWVGNGTTGTIGTNASSGNLGVFQVDVSNASAGAYLRTSRDTGAANAIAQFWGASGQALIRGDGDLENTNNRYTGISDIKFKQNIEDASSQWADIKNIRVRKYELIADPERKQIGVVAQELEEVSPGLVIERVYDEDTGETAKSVAYSVLYMKAVKALQEAMERIETLEAKVNALEGN